MESGLRKSLEKQLANKVTYVEDLREVISDTELKRLVEEYEGD